MLYLSGDLSNPGDLYIASLDGTNERQVTCFNDELLDSIAFPRVEELLYNTGDGTPDSGLAAAAK